MMPDRVILLDEIEDLRRDLDVARKHIEAMECARVDQNERLLTARERAARVKGALANSQTEVNRLREQRDALRAEVARLREGIECHVARPGEGTYECRVDDLCPACRLRRG